MHVCMSENLYLVRLKQKSHSRAAVSNKQTRLRCPFEPFSGQVGWTVYNENKGKYTLKENMQTQGFPVFWVWDSVGIPTDFSVGMGWVKRLRSNPHGAARQRTLCFAGY